MPFQDADDEVATTPYSSSPSVLERWLRKIFIEDWFLKLLALAIAVLLWLAVTGANRPVTIRTAVQLNFIRPDKLEISNDPPRTVDVLLTGRRAKIERRPADLVATVDLSDQHEGERVVRLTADRVQIDLPEGLRIEAFQPSTIPIHLESIVERQLPVQPKLEGTPADGYEVYGARSSPDKVTVRGTASQVNSLKEAPTETISVAGKKESFSVPRVAIDIPNHKIDLVDSAVDVTVEIGEHGIEKTFHNVQVSAEGELTAPRKAVSVTLVGPASLLSHLKPENLTIALTPSGAGFEPHLSLPGGTQGRVSIKTINPPLVSQK